MKKAIRRLSSPESFIAFYTQHMGELYAKEHDLDIVRPAVKIGFDRYQNIKDKLKPYTARLFQRFPDLYVKGKTFEKRIRRNLRVSQIMKS